MFSLETIVALNKKAQELADEDRPIREAYAEIGINMTPRSESVRPMDCCRSCRTRRKHEV